MYHHHVDTLITIMSMKHHHVVPPVYVLAKENIVCFAYMIGMYTCTHRTPNSNVACECLEKERSQ